MIDPKSLCCGSWFYVLCSIWVIITVIPLKQFATQGCSMRHILLCIAILLLGSGPAFAQELEKSRATKPKVPEFPATGRWTVVSQTSGPNLLAVPNNDLFLSEGLLAEYDRINKPNSAMVSLYNVKWRGEGTKFSTELYRSPSVDFKIERFSEKNVAAFCYLQIRKNSALLLISESKIDGDPFVSDGPAAKMDANARMLTLFRVDMDSKSRMSHLKAHARMVNRIFGKTTLREPESEMIGGFLDEYRNAAPGSSN